MSRDITEQIDDICRAEYGHTNWAFTDTLSKKELEEIKNNWYRSYSFCQTKCSKN